MAYNTDVYTQTDDPEYVRTPSGRIVPRSSIDPQASVVNASNPLDVSTPTVAQAETGSPDFDRKKVDEVMGRLDVVRGKLTQLADLDRRFSLAGAQASQQRANAQSAALGQARTSAPRSRAAAASNALAAESGAESDIAGKEALGRATEADNDQRFHLKAAESAAKLGLSQAAAEFDISKVNLDATKSYLNNLFADNRIKMKVNDDQAQRVADYAHSLALIGAERYKLSNEQWNRAQDRLIARYDLSEGVKTSLAQIEANDPKWYDTLLGIAQASTPIAAAYIGSGTPDSGGQSTNQAAGAAANAAGHQSFTPVSGADSSGGAGFYNGGR